MNQNEQKKAAAQQALKYLRDDIKLGVGTGTTVDCFIDALAESHLAPKHIVSSSEASTVKLKAKGFQVDDLNYVGELDVYVDGCDEINALKQMIKGGGGALTREKILACAAKQFICIADASKRVNVLGSTCPLPVEVIPGGRSYVARRIISMGGMPEWRDGFITDNGNIILDIREMDLSRPHQLERELSAITGVVCVGLFADRRADMALIAQENGEVKLF